MTDTAISQLPAATSLSSSDVVPVVNSGVTKKAALAALLAGMYNGSMETRTTAGALSLTTNVSIVTNSGITPITMTLGTGTTGQVKIIIAESLSSTVIISATGNNWTSLSLTVSGNSLTLIYLNNKWNVLSRNLG